MLKSKESVCFEESDPQDKLGRLLTHAVSGVKKRNAYIWPRKRDKKISPFLYLLGDSLSAK